MSGGRSSNRTGGYKKWTSRNWRQPRLRESLADRLFVAYAGVITSARVEGIVLPSPFPFGRPAHAC